MTRTPTRPAGAGSARDRLALARKLDARVRRLVSRTNRAEALVAGLLYTMAGQGLDRALGFKNLNAYARSVADWDATKTSRMVTLVGNLEHLPEMRKAFFRGELPWTKACIGAAAAVLKPETDVLWTERVCTQSRETLEEVRCEEANEPAQYKVMLVLTAEQKASVEDAVVALRRESDDALSVSSVVAEVCRRLVQGGGVAAGPRPLVALGVCAECETVTHGTVTVPVAEAATALCHSEIVDFTIEPPARSRTIRPSVAAQVLARDQGRCRVPGCDNSTWLELHHEGGWRTVGHDPGSILTICGSHHRARHAGLLRIVFDAGRATFTLADGEILGEVDLRVLRRGSRSPAPAQTAIARDVKRDARKSLVALGISVKDAESAIAASGDLPTAELLVKEALRRTPGRGAIATPTPDLLSTRSLSA